MRVTVFCTLAALACVALARPLPPTRPQQPGGLETVPRLYGLWPNNGQVCGAALALSSLQAGTVACVNGSFMHPPGLRTTFTLWNGLWDVFTLLSDGSVAVFNFSAVRPWLELGSARVTIQLFMMHVDMWRAGTRLFEIPLAIPSSYSSSLVLRAPLVRAEHACVHGMPWQRCIQL
jgi:hypothetical protein